MKTNVFIQLRADLQNNNGMRFNMLSTHKAYFNEGDNYVVVPYFDEIQKENRDLEVSISDIQFLEGYVSVKMIEDRKSVRGKVFKKGEVYSAIYIPNAEAYQIDYVDELTNEKRSFPVHSSSCEVVEV